MGELEADYQIIDAAESFSMRFDENLAQVGQIALVLPGDDRLLGVGAVIGGEGHSFAAINELGAAFAEALPAPPHFLRRAASRGAVPTFHRLDRPTIADLFAVDQNARDRLAKRR